MARTYLLVFFVLLSLPLLAQQVDLENIDTQLKEKLKKKPFSILGSASVSGVYNEAFMIGRCLSIIDTPIKETL